MFKSLRILSACAITILTLFIGVYAFASWKIHRLRAQVWDQTVKQAELYEQLDPGVDEEWLQKWMVSDYHRRLKEVGWDFE